MAPRHAQGSSKVPEDPEYQARQLDGAKSYVEGQSLQTLNWSVEHKIVSSGYGDRCKF